MTYQGRYRHKGFLLFDIILALTLSSLLISLLSYASLNAEDIYQRSVTKKMLLSAYQQHQSDFGGLMPGEERIRSYIDTASSSPVYISGQARWYGNDRIETEIQASTSGRSIVLSAVRAYPFASYAESAGQPLCSADFGQIASIIPILLPISAAWPLTDVQVRNGRAYITVDSATQADPDLIVADVRDPKHPVVLSTLNTGPGLRALAVAGTYVYAAAASGAAQLHVVRMTAQHSVQLARKYQLPLPEASTSPPFGTAIFYEKEKIYLGTEKWDGEEFSIIDVRAPESPQKIGGLDTGSKVNSIGVRNGTAYVAASDQHQLRHVDVRSAMPAVQQIVSPSGWQRQEGSAVVQFETAIGFGRTSGGFDIANDKELFLWEGGSSTPAAANIPGGAYGMVLDRSHVFAITRTADQELMVADRTLSTSTAAYYSLPVLPQAITCDLGAIYILAKTAPALYEITFKH